MGGSPLWEEQFISIYLSALKVGLLKAEGRHLYARPAERMNSPVFLLPTHFLHTTLSLTFLPSDCPICSNNLPSLPAAFQLCHYGYLAAVYFLHLFTQMVLPYNAPFHHKLSLGDLIWPPFVTFLWNFCLPEKLELFAFLRSTKQVHVPPSQGRFF